MVSIKPQGTGATATTTPTPTTVTVVAKMSTVIIATAGAVDTALPAVSAADTITMTGNVLAPGPHLPLECLPSSTTYTMDAYLDQSRIEDSVRIFNPSARSIERIPGFLPQEAPVQTDYGMHRYLQQTREEDGVRLFNLPSESTNSV